MTINKTSIGLMVPFLLALSFESFAQEASDASPSINPILNTIVEKHLSDGMKTYDAMGAAGAIMNAKTGEIVASVSLNRNPSEAYNRVTDGSYTISSVSKLTTIAMGLESGAFKMESRVDARFPLKIGRYNIHDYYPQKRQLNLSEVFVYSSNIAIARIGLKVGGSYQNLFLNAMGQRDPINNGVLLARQVVRCS